MKLRLVFLAVLALLYSLSFAVDPWGEPAVLTGSMAITAQVSIGGTPAATGDVVAAFVTVGGTPQLRGKQGVQVFGGISGCILQVYTESNGEVINFKVWDESAQQVIDVTQTLNSEVNGSVGSYPDNMYQINAGAAAQVVATPTFTPVAGTYSVAQNVTISCTTAGAQIRYTTNGTEPTETSALYSTPINVATTTTIKAKGFLTAWTPSATATALYTISGGMVTDPWGTPATLTGSMTVMAQVSIDSVPAANGDILAAFVTVGGTDQLRGKVPIQIIQGISGCIIQVYTESNGEQVMFKVWDYSAQTIVPVTQTLASEVNGSIGSFPDNLYQINAGAAAQVVATPTFNPVGGTYQTAQSVTISCTTVGAQIRYTTNGTDPTEASALYSAPISMPLNSTTTLKAKAFLTGWTPSAIAAGTYIITGTVATPTFSPVAGTYSVAQNVTISCTTAGAQIRYTTNGTEPTEASALYSTPINVATTTTIKVKGFLNGWTPSSTATALYTISGGMVTDPWGTPPVLTGSMTVMAQVSINSIPATADDILAAFVTVGGTDELRGKVPVQVIQGISGCIILIYTESNGEEVKFKVWDYSAQTIVPVTQTLLSEVNASIGEFPNNLYPINAGTGTQIVAMPVFNPVAGTYTTAQSVAITCSTAGAQIRYTTNGTDPTEASTLYSTPINLPLNSTTTIKAKAFLSGWTPSTIASATYTITGTVATPTFSPVAGTYITAQNVSIACATAGVQVRYTTDGTEPTATSTLYSAPINVAVTTTLKAKAFKAGWVDSATATALYTITGTVATPTFTPVAGTYTTAQSVTLACATAGAQIRYTNDGTEPTATSTLYSAPINVATTTTLKAKGFLAGWTPSATVTALYTITGTVATPTFTPVAGSYTTAQSVTIACTTAGAQIRYTTNGTDPTEASTLYSTPVNMPLNSTTTLKAKAFLTGWTPSAIINGVYVITGTVATPVITPPTGTYTTAQTVTITCSTAGAQIRFTTDGTEPTTSSTLYSAPINVATSSTVKAKGFLSNWTNSATASVTYTITGTVAVPTFSPEPGQYVNQVDVSLACATAAAQIRYTLDGTEPTATSTLYAAPIHLTQTTTIKSKGFKVDWATSATATGIYNVSVSNPEDPAAPVVPGIQDVYPNPFSTSTNIKLGISGANQAYSLKIYNIKGECVYRTESNAKGNIQLNWNGYGNDGKKLPSGIYLISFKSGELSQTRKAVMK